MVARIGFATTKETEEKDSPRGQASYCNQVYTMEYTERVQRLVTTISISAGMDGFAVFSIEKAAWDTGSTQSCISETMARKLGLQPIDKGVGITASGDVEIPYYMADIYLTPDIVFRNMKICGFPMKMHDVDFLIGMDVISKGDFCVKNSDEKTIVTFNAAKS